MSSVLLAKTLELYRSRPAYLTQKDVADGAGVSVRFIQEILSNKARQPDVFRIEALYKYLSGKSLEL